MVHCEAIFRDFYYANLHTCGHYKTSFDSAYILKHYLSKILLI